MRIIKKRFFIVASLFISGINPLWATNSQSVNVYGSKNISQEKRLYLSNSNKNKENQKNIQANKPFDKISQTNLNLQNLKYPINLYLPKTPNEVSIKELQDIKIEDIKEILINNNQQLKATQKGIASDKAFLRSVIASRYPTLSLSANGLPKYLQSKSYISNSLDYSSKQLSSSISAQVKWDLIDPSRSPQIAAARDKFEQSKHTYSIILRDLHLAALNRYYNLQRSDEEIKIANKSLESSKVGLKDAEAKFESGVGSKLEVLEAKTQVARDQQLLNIKNGQQKTNQRSLAEILNLPHHITPIIGSPKKIMGFWDTTLEESIIAAYSFREELDNILLDISISNSNANAAMAYRKPKISLVNTFTSSFTKGDVNSFSPSMENSSSSISNTIGLNATWNILDGGRSKELYKYNKFKAEEAESKFAVQRAKIRREVEETFFKLESSYLNISSTFAEVLSARESLRLAKLRYKAGMATQREVVNNQRDLTDAEVRYVISITSYNGYLAELQRRTGLDKIKACKISTLDLENQPPQNPKQPKDTTLIPLCKV